MAFWIIKKTLFKGDPKLNAISLQNFNLLKGGTDDASRHFRRFLPEDIIRSPEGKLEIHFSERTIPLIDLGMPQEHVNWILSRMLEWCAWLSQRGFIHGGINPESVCLVPETHGIILTTFYHLCPLNTRIRTISARYKNWYPSSLFHQKRAVSAIDLELCKRTAAYLLGDRSGLGIKLKKTHHPAFVNFLLKRHTNAFECYERL